MGWKQTLILGGAVLLLAACDRATAPIANARDGGAAVMSTRVLKGHELGDGSDTTSTTDPSAPAVQDVLPCGISISSGELAPVDTVCTGL